MDHPKVNQSTLTLLHYHAMMPKTKARQQSKPLRKPGLATITVSQFTTLMLPNKKMHQIAIHICLYLLQVK
jgi:hypothetical protein